MPLAPADFPVHTAPMSMHDLNVIGTTGQPWGDAERALWRAQQQRQRSYADDVLAVAERLRGRFDLHLYGELDYAPDRYPLVALRSRRPRPECPWVLITGGVHGYETSGVHGALHFLSQQGESYAERANLLVAPCVSPWAYERIHRWNPHAVDPNRSFRVPSPGLCPEADALMQLVSPLMEQVKLHIDLHETTDTDETIFGPALAARDGTVHQPEPIPDGFYLVGDSENPQIAFQQAVITAVARVTHIAAPDAQGQLIGTPLAAPGVIVFPVRTLGLCAGMTRARYATTTEVYPDSPRVDSAQCNAAQAAAVCAAIDYLLANGSAS